MGSDFLVPKFAWFSANVRDYLISPKWHTLQNHLHFGLSRDWQLEPPFAWNSFRPQGHTSSSLLSLPSLFFQLFQLSILSWLKCVCSSARMMANYRKESWIASISTRMCSAHRSFAYRARYKMLFILVGLIIEFMVRASRISTHSDIRNRRVLWIQEIHLRYHA